MLPVHKSMHVMVLDVMLDVVAVTVLDVIVLSVTVLQKHQPGQRSCDG